MLTIAAAPSAVSVGSTELSTSPVGPTKSRSCSGCMLPISSVRLKAMPSARMCVSCQEKAGDVPVLRRIDNSYFVDNAAIDAEIRRRNHGAENSTHLIAADLMESRDAYSPESSSVQATGLGAAVKEADSDPFWGNYTSYRQKAAA